MMPLSFSRATELEWLWALLHDLMISWMMVSAALTQGTSDMANKHHNRSPCRRSTRKNRDRCILYRSEEERDTGNEGDSDSVDSMAWAQGAEGAIYCGERQDRADILLIPPS